jgi:RNA polymerase sigma-70 factor (ECF subfamily)
MAKLTEQLDGLLARAQQGDMEAFNELLGAARARLAEYARRTTLDEDLAEDVVQDSLLEMQGEFGGFSGMQHFWGWLYTTVNYKTQHHLGKRWRQRGTQSLADVERDVEDHRGHDGLEAAVTGELKDAVMEAMRQLSPEDRAVLSLRVYEGLSFSQVGQRSGCRAITARARFWRAKQALGRKLAASGFGRKALVPVALLLFGKLTAASEAAAAELTVSASSLSAGLAGAVLGVAASRAAVVTVAAAGVVAVGVGVKGLSDGREAKVEDAGTPAITVSAPLPDDGRATIRTWYYYPEPSGQVALSKGMRYDEDEGTYECLWLQNGFANYRYQPEEHTVYIVNANPRAEDLSVRQLPTDSPELRAFLAGTQQKGVDFGAGIRAGGGSVGGLLAVAEWRGGVQTLVEATHHPNLRWENYFDYDWPADVRVVDERDAMHAREWTYFEMEGTIGGKAVRGRGRAPFVYAATAEHRPWLEVEVGGKHFVDCDGGRLFAGLSRPWEGLHTIDTIRRDAAREGLPFETHMTGDGARATVKVASGDMEMVYTIDMERDLLERIEFTGSAQGQVVFSYMEKVEGTEIDMAPPRANDLPQGNTGGPRWLVCLAQN